MWQCTEYTLQESLAIEKAVTLLKNPYEIWTKSDIEEKQKLFYFIFDEKLAYSKKEGYRTNKTQSYTRLFEEFTTQNTTDVDLGIIFWNQVGRELEYLSHILKDL